MSSFLCESIPRSLTLAPFFGCSAILYTASKFTQHPLTVTEALKQGFFSKVSADVFFNSLATPIETLVGPAVQVYLLYSPPQGRPFLSSCAMVATAIAVISAMIPLVKQSLLSYC